jgi:putative PIN family toxin of toxin-antitoxin system
MKPRVVLDTNILLDLFYFKDISVAYLHDCLKTEQVQAFTCELIWEEFAEVLMRKPFNQSVEEIHWIRSNYQHILTWQAPEKNSSGIKCRDKDDQIFVELAVEVAPCTLITKDKDLLILHKKLQKFQVQTVKQYLPEVSAQKTF